MQECRELSSIVSEFERLYRRVLELIDLNKAAELEGYLWKTGPRGKAYDKRFFQLRGNILSYARKVKESTVARRIIRNAQQLLLSACRRAT